MRFVAYLVLIGGLLAACSSAPVAAPTATPAPPAPTPIVIYVTPAPTPAPSPTLRHKTPGPSPTDDGMAVAGYIEFSTHRAAFVEDVLTMLGLVDVAPDLATMAVAYEGLGEMVFDELLWVNGNDADECYETPWLLYQRALEQMSDGIDEVLAGLRSVDVDRIEAGGDTVMLGVEKLNESRNTDHSC